MKITNKPSSNGFTFIELMLVVSLLGLLSFFALQSHFSGLNAIRYRSASSHFDSYINAARIHATTMQTSISVSLNLVENRGITAMTTYHYDTGRVIDTFHFDDEITCTINPIFDTLTFSKNAQCRFSLGGALLPENSIATFIFDYQGPHEKTLALYPNTGQLAAQP